ncbi:DMT family transporter [Rhizorhapis suberifaciens]|uniref:Drug/metabolite transporter (DMT)-like permease n=1 Tax=Rhizorhapis suberifaciens TaxID=13656 RepID=A0A840HZ64_9SPHN|nr:DMT family transporter [Rhizorhapis suberifaciens]MBB4642859.1 drug/metabolite transporter (DMT)-like permease [Rhizorhapis suberifaciens]
MAYDMRGGTSLIQSVGTPALFVVLWSTGFIGARLGLPHAGPLTFLSMRYALAAGLLVLVSLASRAPWPLRWTEVGHFAVAGLLVHGIYLGGVFLGISMGIGAGVSALIVGLQPLLTAALAGVLLGERVTPRQWLGLALGLFGVTLVLAGKVGQAPGSLLGSIACVAALIGITVGTLYQKRFCAGMDLRTGSVIQFVAAGLATAPLAFWLEDMHVRWDAEFVFALLWLVLVLSLGAVSLLYVLIRRGAASKVVSLFFLVPPSTALIAWPLFGETLGLSALAGMAITAIGVALASHVEAGGATPFKTRRQIHRR